MKRNTTNRKSKKSLEKHKLDLKKPTIDDIIQHRTNVLIHQQKGGSLTKFDKGKIEERRTRIKMLYINSINKDQIERLFLLSIQKSNNSL